MNWNDLTKLIATKPVLTIGGKKWKTRIEGMTGDLVFFTEDTELFTCPNEDDPNMISWCFSSEDCEKYGTFRDEDVLDKIKNLIQNRGS